MKRLFLLTLSILLVAVFSIATAQEGTTYYINVRSAKIRAEANTKAAVVVTLRRGDAVVAIGEPVEGTRVSGSTTWYHIQSGSYEGYVHSSLVTTRAPAAAVSTPVPGNTVIPTVAPVISSGGGGSSGGVSCNGATTCGAMASCEQAFACLAAGRGSLDRDKDGVPCESICPGG